MAARNYGGTLLLRSHFYAIKLTFNCLFDSHWATLRDWIN